MTPHGPTYLYAGGGSWNVSVDQTQNMLEKVIDPRGIKRVTSLSCIDQETHLVVIPGGNAPSMSDYHDLTREKVSGYVENGGRILGICAGAILLTDVIYSKPRFIMGNSHPESFIRPLKEGKLFIHAHDQKANEFGISVFPGFCVAPHIVNEYRDPANPENFCAVDVVTNDQTTFKAAHYSGPAFFKTPSEATILLRYKIPVEIQRMNHQILSRTSVRYSLEDEKIVEEAPVAALSYPLGKGKMVLTGIHPEMNPETFSETAKKLQIETKLPDGLQTSNSNREALINTIFAELKI